MLAASLEDTVPRDARVADYWAEFCRRAAVPPATPYQAWYFGDSPQLAHELVELVLHGPKRATAGLVEYHERHPEEAAVADGYSILTEFDGTPRAVIRTVWLDRRPLREVDAQFAWDEGEGDRTLADWMDGHRRYFSRVCPTLGIAFSDETAVQLERFELLYPFDAATDPVGCGPRIVPSYLPGAIGAVTALLAEFHAREFSFGPAFEAETANELGGFIARFEPSRDCLWLLADRGAILGALAVEGQRAEAAQLRWFIVADTLRGRGLGRRMLDAAMAFCGRRGHRRVQLTTLAGLDVARALYERSGFRLVDERAAGAWGATFRRQLFECTP